MNREILFRGKLIGNDRWSYGNLVIKHNSISIITPDSTPLGRYGQVMPETERIARPINTVNADDDLPF